MPLLWVFPPRGRCHNGKTLVLPPSSMLKLHPVFAPTRWAVGVACAALLLGCQTPPPTGSVGPSPTSQAPGYGSADSAAATAAVPVPREGEIAGILTAVRNLLDAGQEAAAVTDIERVLAFDAQNKTATSLMRQIREDPTALYGRESFAYRVQSGDTLASIAQRYMNDRDQFYGLARYNSIEVPRQLPVGQMIRIPGKQPRVPPPPAPAAAAPAAPPPPPAAQPPQAPPPAPVAQPQAPDPRIEAARLENERKTAVAKWTRTARTAMARQDVCGAIAAWNQVLGIDPGNRTAVLEREKALELKKRLPSAKC